MGFFPLRTGTSWWNLCVHIIFGWAQTYSSNVWKNPPCQSLPRPVFLSDNCWFPLHDSSHFYGRLTSRDATCPFFPHAASTPVRQWMCLASGCATIELPGTSQPFEFNGSPALSEVDLDRHSTVSLGESGPTHIRARRCPRKFSERLQFVACGKMLDLRSTAGQWFHPPGPFDGRDNLLGNRDFCPTVRRTPALQQHRDRHYGEKVRWPLSDALCAAQLNPLWNHLGRTGNG